MNNTIINILIDEKGRYLYSSILYHFFSLCRVYVCAIKLRAEKNTQEISYTKIPRDIASKIGS